MDIWADYLISEASYGPGRQLLRVNRHKITEQGISEGTVTDKLTLVSDIKNKVTYVTGHKTSGGWKRGDRVEVFLLDGNPFVRVDNNRVAYDHLGSLPEMNEETSQQTGRVSKITSLLAKLRKKHIVDEAGTPEMQTPPGLSAADILQEDMVRARPSTKNETGKEDDVTESVETESGKEDDVTESVETESVETESVETESVETESVETESVETESVETESVETESVETESVETESVESDEGVAKKAETEEVESPSTSPWGALPKESKAGGE